jgi:hypothetical protein
VPLLLRKVKLGRWLEAAADVSSELPSDPLGDLGTDQGVLSTWEVADDRSNLRTVVTALAASNPFVSNIDVALVESGRVMDLGYEIRSDPGRTPLLDVAELHRDLIVSTASRLIEFAEAIRQTAQFESFSENEVLVLLAEALSEGRLSADKLQQRVREKLEKRNLP